MSVISHVDIYTHANLILYTGHTLTCRLTWWVISNKLLSLCRDYQLLSSRFQNHPSIFSRLSGVGHGGSRLSRLFQMFLSPAAPAVSSWGIPEVFPSQMRCVIAPVSFGSPSSWHPGGSWSASRTTPTGSFWMWAAARLWAPSRISSSFWPGATCHHHRRPYFCQVATHTAILHPRRVITGMTDSTGKCT